MADDVKKPKDITAIPIGDRNDPTTKLMIARDLTKRTGILVELQVHQLRVWPGVILGAAESEADFDFDKKRVVFKVKSWFNGGPPADITARLGNLKQCVQFLLGDNYVIQVKNGNRILK